jgi:hypothetical protein
MQNRSSQTLTWPEVLSAVRAATGASVLIRDGKVTQPAGAVRNRPAAKGTELCLFVGEAAVSRASLIEQMEALSKSAGRRFMTSARAKVGDSSLLVERVIDETVDGVVYVLIDTRRPKLGFNQSQQIGATSTLRSKRIKNG